LYFLGETVIKATSSPFALNDGLLSGFILQEPNMQKTSNKAHVFAVSGAVMIKVGDGCLTMTPALARSIAGILPRFAEIADTIPTEPPAEPPSPVYFSKPMLPQ
jgi:hypothetical protein